MQNANEHNRYPLCQCGHRHDRHHLTIYHRDAGDPRDGGCWECDCKEYRPVEETSSGRTSLLHRVLPTIQPVMVTVDRSPGPNYLRNTLCALDLETLSRTYIYNSGSSDYISHIVQDDFAVVIHHDPAVCANINVAEALESGAETDAEFVLFLEDDIDVVGDFYNSVRLWLADHISSLPTIYPLGANYTEVTDAHSRGETWWPYPVERFYGTQAFLIRSRDVKVYADYIRAHCYDLHADGTGYDHLIRDCAISLGVQHFITPAPSFVQHVGEHSAIARRDKIHTFPSWPGREWTYKGIVQAQLEAGMLVQPQPQPSTLCVLTPMRNARRFLDTYFSQLVSLREELGGSWHVRLVVAEGDSTDGTRLALHQYAQRHSIDYTLVDTTHGMQYYRSVEDPRRLAMMSDVMNSAFGQVKDSDDVVMWIMADVTYTASTITAMIAHTLSNNDIAAPFVLTHDGKFWDTWAFRLNGQRFNHEPPFVPGPHGWDDFISLDSAGTCLVMPGEIARTCRASDLEAVSFCEDARSRTYRVVIHDMWTVYHNYTANRRALVVGEFQTTTGFSRCTAQLLPELSSLGYEIDLIAIDWNVQRPHNLPYNIWSARMTSRDDTLGCAQLERMLKYKQYDLLIVLGDTFTMPHYIQSISRSPVENLVKIAWLAVDSENQLVASQLHRGFDRVIVWTDYAREELERRGCTVPINVVPLGCDTSIFTDEMSQHDARKFLIDLSGGGLDDSFYNAFIVGVVGRNQPRKRIDLAIEAFTKARNDGIPNSYLLLHCASAPILGCDIDAVALYHKVDDRIVRLDSILNDVDMAKLYRALDVLLVTSEAEGFCLPVLEAMACSVPCIVPADSALASWTGAHARLVDTAATCVVAPIDAGAYTIGRVVNTDEAAWRMDEFYRDRGRGREYSLRNYALSVVDASRELAPVISRVVERVASERASERASAPASADSANNDADA